MTPPWDRQSSAQHALGMCTRLRGVCSLNLGYLNLFVHSLLPVLPSSCRVPCLGEQGLCPCRGSQGAVREGSGSSETKHIRLLSNTSAELGC